MQKVIEVETEQNHRCFVFAFDNLHVIKLWRLWQLDSMPRYYGLIWDVNARKWETNCTLTMYNHNRFECTYTHFRPYYNIFYARLLRKREGSFSSSFYNGQNYYDQRNSSSLFPISLSLSFFSVVVFMLSIVVVLCSLNRTGRHCCCIIFFSIWKPFFILISRSLTVSALCRGVIIKMYSYSSLIQESFLLFSNVKAKENSLFTFHIHLFCAKSFVNFISPVQ